MSVSLNSIPIDIRVPGQYLEIDASKAVSGLPAAAQKILVIGQRLAAGAVAALVPTRMVSAAQAAQAFGRGSMLASMIAALKAVNDQTECWAIALDDAAAGAAATGTLPFTGTATAAGTLALMIDGVPAPVAVAIGDTAAQVATKVAAAIAALPDLPVTAAAAAGTVTLTARNKGVAGNSIDLRLDYYQGDAIPAGLGCVPTAMNGGTGNPDLGDVWAVLGDAQYQTIILPYTDAANLASATTELDRRWGPMVQKEGMAFAGFRGSMSDAAALGATLNSAWLSILPMLGSPSSPWAIASAFGGTIAYYGAIDPARPFQTLPLTGILAPSTADRFTRDEHELLLHDGMSTSMVADGGAVLIERAITTFQTDAFGLPSVAFLDVNTPLTLAYLRFAVRARIAAKFPRMKLADDSAAFGPGQAIVTPKIIRAELIALFGELEEAGLVEDMDQFKADLIVERDATDKDRVNALIPPNIVNQFRVFAGAVQFRL